MPVTSTNLGSVQNFRTRTDYSMGGTRKRHGSILNLTTGRGEPGARPVGRFRDREPHQSYNFQDRYLRHYNYLLRIDPVTTTQERADATFRVAT